MATKAELAMWRKIRNIANAGRRWLFCYNEVRKEYRRFKFEWTFRGTEGLEDIVPYAKRRLEEEGIEYLACELKDCMSFRGPYVALIIKIPLVKEECKRNKEI